MDHHRSAPLANIHAGESFSMNKAAKIRADHLPYRPNWNHLQPLDEECRECTVKLSTLVDIDIDIDIDIDFIYFDSVQANLRHKINQRLSWRP